ncbi:helix-turn-helix domain-containing protein [Gordonia sp. 852002-51296_SCH5728562-b]|uniref:helix-turn-helix domain-containing protein n=1 Tax=Gordonia sp. 852002-51296_SCH5728562-b TaxID=1834101 RepID=UPI0007EA7C65|nr:helix-turn-helix domain-containing protein [Gordonia sp. 852002-51296_SCH5728562-b]OBA40772.1 hypothetical protein A5766_01910 [Gordonia sp. 852002-51296_SCH5728562-b]
MDDRYHQRFFRRCTIAFAATTILLNAADAVMVSGGGEWNRAGAAVAAALMPVSLLLATEATTRLVQAAGGSWEDRLPTALVAVGALFGAAMSFGGSFSALSRLAAHWKWEHPAFLPLSIDTLLIVMAVGGVWAARRIARDTVADDPAATSTATTGEWVTAEVPTTSSSGSAVPADDPAASIDELSPPSPTSVTDDPGELVAVELAATARRAVDLGLHPGDDLADERRRADTGEPTTGTDELTTTTPTSVTDDPGELVADELAATPTSDTDEWRRRADEVLAKSQIAADPDELARVLRLAASGASKQSIADDVGRSRSTVSGWLRVAAGDPQAPKLAAVR